MVVGKRGGLGGQATARRGPGIEKMVIKPNYRNVSVFTFLQSGCFEREHLSFCPARISGFSCVHWIDPDLSRRAENRSTAYCPMGNYPSTEVIQAISCIVIPIVLIVGIPLLLAMVYATRRTGISLLHFCIYLTLIALFDMFELLMLSTNVIGRAFFSVHFLDSITLMSRTACVVTTLMINSLRHLQSALIITLAIETWRFSRNPVKVNRTLRSEWVKNCSILIATTCLFVNCQYFWTFDVSEHDNRVLHGRLVPKAYECSYAMNLLSAAYTAIVWPLIDIGLGNVIPVAVCFMFAGWATFMMRKRRRGCGRSATNGNLLTLYQSHFIDVDFVFQVLTASTIICLTYAVFALPETSYVLWKFISFFGVKHNIPFDSKAVQLAKAGTQSKLTSGSKKYVETSPQDKLWREVEPYHQILDITIVYFRLLNIILKPIILFAHVRRFRVEVCAFLNRRFQSVGNRISKELPA